MIYPEYLKKGDKVAISALSGGCSDALEDLDLAIKHLSRFKLTITPDCYGDMIVSSDTRTRVNEFNGVLDNNKMVFICRGGDHLMETIPYLNYQKIVDNKIWIEGYSDPTSLLYILTTKYDLASIYAYNGKNFHDLDKSRKINLKILGGKLVKQKNYDKMCYSFNGDINEKGILIGGCTDVLLDVFHSEFDNTSNFLDKYKDFGFIWYFDIFDMKSKEVDEFLNLMVSRNYFKNTKAILVGKLMFNQEEDYDKCFKKLGIPVIMDVCIGHVKPTMTLINGMIGKIDYHNHKLSIEMEKINENIS